MALTAPGQQLNLNESPSWGSRSVDCFEKLEQIGEGTYGSVTYSQILLSFWWCLYDFYYFWFGEIICFQESFLFNFFLYNVLVVLLWFMLINLAKFMKLVSIRSSQLSSNALLVLRWDIRYHFLFKHNFVS